MSAQPSDRIAPGPLELVMISAWNQSGGAFLHRLFDGHPSVRAYPFELQLGTAESRDGLSEWVPLKYRWTRVPTGADALPPRALWDAFIDEELKERVFLPTTSKFREFDLRFDLESAQIAFAEYINGRPRTTCILVDAYIRSVFDGWTNRVARDDHGLVVGHCPMAIVDADRALTEMPRLRYLHVMRNPFSGFADTRRRIADMTIERYCQRWGTVNLLGMFYAEKYPDRCRIVRFEQLLTNREAVMRDICAWLRTEFDASLMKPSWNGRTLKSILPFGGVAGIGLDHEERCLAELTGDEMMTIGKRLAWHLTATGYTDQRASLFLV